MTSTTTRSTDEERKARKKAYQAEWYKKNKARVIQKVTDWQRDNKERVNAKTRDWKKQNPETSHKKKDRWFRSAYGITLAQRDSLLQQQGGVCAICRTDKPSSKGWFVDHCHDAGTVRGILCLHCNTMLGHARDNPAVLAAGIHYLKAYQNGEQETQAA